ncbi:hypothetical protein RJT34_31124 [Clitoria ternatea]|uniref:Uncharacterized protein n=1 Tax=Clitoria ternatea TaxID=43366 RepID=A0AAN9EU34_CLITE
MRWSLRTLFFGVGTTPALQFEILVGEVTIYYFYTTHCNTLNLLLTLVESTISTFFFSVYLSTSSGKFKTRQCW